MNVENDDDNDDSAPIPSSPTTLTTEQEDDHPARESMAYKRILRNFLLMAFLFSCNHGCVVACLSLATAQLGSLGAWQSGILYMMYSISGLLGSTYIVKTLGSKYSLMVGMGLYCAYVGAFYGAVHSKYSRAIALVGAVLGGVGAGFLWTAQGSYFAQAATMAKTPTYDASAEFAGLFAFIYLVSEVALRSLSTVLLELGISWSSVFAIYSVITFLTTILMGGIDNLPPTDELTTTRSSTFYKITAAWQLLRRDPKMKYMIGLNAVFGFASSFLTSYVNGEVVRQVISPKYIGVLSAWVSCVAAGSSLVFGKLQRSRDRILVTGAVCFGMVGMGFLVFPDTRHWNLLSLLIVYSLHGVGRATFEGTLRSTFADFFPSEKEGAFANIILQNGLSSSLGFFLTFALLCSESKKHKFGSYCVQYKDGSYHDVLSFELLIVSTAVCAILGYLMAAKLYREEDRRGEYEDVPYESVDEANDGTSGEY